jgi:hypothetical protein
MTGGAIEARRDPAQIRAIGLRIDGLRTSLETAQPGGPGAGFHHKIHGEIRA